MSTSRSLVGAFLVAGSSAALAQDEATDAAALRDYVQRLESRISELEKDREWPLAHVRMQSGSALEAAIRSVNLSGYMEFLYSYNLRHDGQIAGHRGDTLDFNQLRTGDADENGFTFRTLHVQAEKPLTTNGSTGFSVQVDYGIAAMIEDVDPNFDAGGTNDALAVPEAIFLWRMPCAAFDHVDWAVGRFRTCFGWEIIESDQNWTVTRNPIAVFGTPGTHTGLRAVAPLADKVELGLAFVNGWDNVRAANDGKAGLFRLVLGRFEDALSSQFQILASYGSLEGSGVPQGNKRRLLEVMWDGKFSENTEFAFDAIWASAGGAITDSLGATHRRDWHGAAANVRHHLTETTWISWRAGWYADDALGTNGARIVDGTVAVGCEVAKDLTVALEYRHDFSRSEGTFLSRSGGSSRHQDTVTASFLYRF